MEIITGKQTRPQKVVIYGSEGIGKTTLASQCPDPLFIDTEGGTAHLNVKRTPPVKSIVEIEQYVMEIVRAAATGNPLCKTVVIDTADWAEQMIIEQICMDQHLKGIEDAGYGKGYVYVAERFKVFLNCLDKCIDAGMNVVVTAHATMRKFEQPDEQGAYDRWELKLSKKTAPLLKEWCDALIFCNYKTQVITTTDKSRKATGGKRVIYTQHRPCWDAKNRHGLDDELPMEYRAIARIFDNSVPTTATDSSTTATNTPTDSSTVAKNATTDSPTCAKNAQTEESTIRNNRTVRDTLREKIKASGITETDVERVVISKGKFPQGTKLDDYPEKFITDWLFRFWNNVVEAAELPF